LRNYVGHIVCAYEVRGIVVHMIRCNEMTTIPPTD
jgi:hypothetical protein